MPFTQRCLIFVFAGCLGLARFIASAQNAPGTLESEMRDYELKRRAGLTRLSEVASAQLGAAQRVEMAAGRLDSANALAVVVKGLPITTSEEPDTKGLPAAATPILRDHIRAVSAGIRGLNDVFVPRLEAVKNTLLKTGDLTGANAVEAKLKQMKEESELHAPKLGAPTRDSEFTVQAYVDGNTELHVTKDGLYWVIKGGEAKVGMNEGSTESCYVNGTRWRPQWRTKSDRGPDTSEVYPFKIKSLALTAEAVSVSKERTGKHEKRTAIKAELMSDHFVITIPDPEGGARWYKLKLKCIE